jgi:hypothetical protein
MPLIKSIGSKVGLVVLSLISGSVYAQSSSTTTTMKFTSTNTTTFGSAPFNFTGDGVANFAWYSGNSELGKVTGQGVSQSAPTGRSCMLPDNSSGIELKLVDHTAVTRFEETGDLLYERGKPGDLVACLNLQNGTFFESGTVSIIGGTGRFKGATGSYTASQNGQILVPPGSDKLQFGFATATYTYTLTVPQGNTPTLGQTVAIASPKDLTTTSRSVQLDASRSVSATSKPLTYKWSIPSGAPNASILGAETATPVVQFQEAYRTYTFQVTVTDSNNKTSTDFVTVNFSGS